MSCMVFSVELGSEFFEKSGNSLDGLLASVLTVCGGTRWTSNSICSSLISVPQETVDTFQKWADKYKKYVYVFPIGVLDCTC